MISVFRKTENGEMVVCHLSSRNAKLTQECMGKDEVSVQVTVDEVLPIREMDYIRVDGEVYTLNRMTDYDEVSDVEFRYNLIFEGVVYNLMDKMYVDVERNSDRFSLTGTLQEFAGLLVVNMSSVDAGWSVGDVPETERKNLTFESVSCREVLNRLSGEFGVEYYLKGRQICFAERFENRTPLVFERGKGKGLYKLTCKNADTGNTVTRVRVYGSSENLPVGYRGGQADRLQLPMVGGQPVPYLEDFSEFKKVVERTVHFDEVKPMFKGAVTTVSDEFNRRITCPAIDFDLKEVAVGDNARVNFLTGDLTGVSFRFEWDNAKKELNLIRQEDQMELPDVDGKRPLIPNAGKKAVAGDAFNFTGISLPQAYVDRAEQDLLVKGREWLSFYKQLRVNFGLDVDYRFLREAGYALHVGDVVTVKVPKLGLEKMLRVLSVEKDLNTGKLSCNVSNYLTESWEKKIEGQIQATQSSVERINWNASYLVEATREWVAQRFARLAGGNRFVGKQEVNGDVELLTGWKLSISDVVLRVVKGVFRTVLSVAGKEGEDVEVEAAGMRAKQVTTGEVSTPDFVSGFLGSGARLKDSHLELDELTVRKRMNVHELMVEKVKSVGGNLILSVGSAKIEAVTDAGDYFRCTYQPAGAGMGNPFVVDDQVLCQTFGGENARRYWRRVVAIGDGYFDLSRADCEAGSAVPEVGDEVVQLGHRTDRSRQSAILLCAVGADAPYTDHYDGIDGFSLAGKLVSREGKLTGIVDEAFGQLAGAGLYAKNVYMRGSLALSTGQKVEERIFELGQEQVVQKETLTELKAGQDGFSVRVNSVEEKATAAEEAVNGLQIGCVNLLENSNVSATNAGYAVISYKYAETLVEGETYTVVFSGRTDGSGRLVFYQDGGLNPVVSLPANTTVDTIVTKTFVFEKAEVADNSLCTFYYIPSGSTGTATVNWAIVVKGNKAPMQWIPSLIDQQAEAERIAQLKAEAERVKAEAYADGKVTAEEQRASREAQAKYEAAVIEAERKALGQSWANGKMLYDDPTFKGGYNNVGVYNNLGNNNVIVSRVPKLADNPVTDSEYNLEITNIGVSEPGLGGFFWGTLSRANGVFIARFIAKIPVGHNVLFRANATGTESSGFFATSNVGTGKWEEYIYVLKCGSEGTFSSTMFFYIDGATSIPSVPVKWYLAYASVFDMTEGSNAQTDAKEAQKIAEHAYFKTDAGRLFLRGTGSNHSTDRMLMLNNDGVNRTIPGRGLNLITIRRSDLQILDNLVYDTYLRTDGACENLANKLNSLDSSVIVCLTSLDSHFSESGFPVELLDAFIRCGGSGVNLLNTSRVPYAFVGIPGIGKGNGIEVFTNNAENAPYAEISTQIVNGVPMGINGAAAAAVTVVKEELLSQIEVNRGEIEARVTKVDFNSLNERVNAAEAKLSLYPDQIDLIVTRDNLVSQINTSADSIKIESNRVEINGKTIFRDGLGDEVHIFGEGDQVFDINGVFKVDKYGALQAKKGVIGGFTITDSSLQQDALKLYQEGVEYSGRGCTVHVGEVLKNMSGYGNQIANLYIVNDYPDAMYTQVCAYLKRNSNSVALCGPGYAMDVKGKCVFSGQIDSREINVEELYVNWVRVKELNITDSISSVIKIYKTGITIDNYTPFAYFDCPDDVNVYLPAAPRSGQILFVRKCGGGNIHIWTTTYNIMRRWTALSNEIWLDNGRMFMFVFTGTYWTVNNMSDY